MINGMMASVIVFLFAIDSHAPKVQLLQSTSICMITFQKREFNYNFFIYFLNDNPTLIRFTRVPMREFSHEPV